MLSFPTLSVSGIPPALFTLFTACGQMMCRGLFLDLACFDEPLGTCQDEVMGRMKIGITRHIVLPTPPRHDIRDDVPPPSPMSRREWILMLLVE